MTKKSVSVGFEKLESRALLSAIPNDPKIIDQWGLSNVSAYKAWDYGTGSKSVIVAIIDSGIDLNHEDLKNNLWVNPGEIPGDGVDNEGNGYIDDINGWNFVDNNNNPQDNYGHGSHIAGVIGAQGNNSIGIVGVNWNISLMPLKVISDRGIGATSSILQAMSYVSMMKQNYDTNIVVANASWASMGGYSQIVYDEISKLNNNNVLFVAAAGNSGGNIDLNPQYPSCYQLDNVISVGALSNDGISVAGISNYGSANVDLVAPGIMIDSTFPWNNNYGKLSGTSMAAPYVAGAVGLLHSVKPGISMNEVKNAIFGSVDKIPTLFGKVVTGGKLNIGAAVCDVLGIPYDKNNLPIGGISNQTLKSVTGWVKDPNSPNVSLNIQLFVDGVAKGVSTTKSDGSFILNVGGLAVGDHIIEVRAKDVQTGSWVSVASTNINIKPPVVNVSYLSLTNIRGWAFSERSGASAVIVRIFINNRLVASQYANQYRAGLTQTVGSSYHGFNIYLNKLWFMRGPNSITIQVYDPISRQTSIAWNGVVNK